MWCDGEAFHYYVLIAELQEVISVSVAAKLRAWFLWGVAGRCTRSSYVGKVYMLLGVVSIMDLGDAHWLGFIL